MVESKSKLFEPDFNRSIKVQTTDHRLGLLATIAQNVDDSAFRLAVWDRPGENVINERLESQPTQSRLISILTATPGNLEAVRKGLANSIERHIKTTHGGRAVRRATIDINSFPIEIQGKQKGATYRGR